MGYNDSLDADRQITTEEWIAARIMDKQLEAEDYPQEISLTETGCGDLGREILKHVLAEFRPDLFDIDPPDSQLGEPSLNTPENRELLGRVYAAYHRAWDLLDELTERLAPGENLVLDGIVESTAWIRRGAESPVDEPEMASFLKDAGLEGSPHAEQP